MSEERAAIVARQLMADRLFSGWGVRTLSTDDEGFNPIGYHRGTVWPHDNSIIAHGLARYGFRDEANRIALAMLEAASFSAYRLPEAFSGYSRVARPLPRPLPDGLQPAGLGDRRAAPPRPRDARARSPRRRGDARPGCARRDRPGVDPRPAGVRRTLGRRGERPKGSRPTRARGLVRRSIPPDDVAVSPPRQSGENWPMTDWRRRSDGPAFLTADELAMRTGTPRERIIELTERGVIQVEAPDHYAPGDVHRIRLVGAFESEGITIDALVAAAEQGRISFAYYDELHPPPGPISPHTYGEFRGVARATRRVAAVAVRRVRPGRAEPDGTPRGRRGGVPQPPPREHGSHGHARCREPHRAAVRRGEPAGRGGLARGVRGRPGPARRGHRADWHPAARRSTSGSSSRGRSSRDSPRSWPRSSRRSTSAGRSTPSAPRRPSASSRKPASSPSARWSTPASPSST